MKRILCLASVLCLFSQSLSAQFDNLSNAGHSWVSMPSQTAMAVDAGAAFYNPAGTLRLPEGISISAGNQFIFKKPMHTADLGLGSGKKTFGDAKADWLLPDVNLVYRHKNYSGFFTYNSPGLGVRADYPNGTISTSLVSELLNSFLIIVPGATVTTDKQSILYESDYRAYTLGGAMAINPKLSVAAGIRYLDAANNIENIAKFTAKIDFLGIPFSLPLDFSTTTEQKATGFGALAGINYHHSEKLSLSARFDSRVKLDFTSTLTSSSTDTILNLDTVYTARRDLPALLALGAAYKPIYGLTIAADFVWFFQTQADWDTIPLSGNYLGSEQAGNACNIGLGATYDLNPLFTLSGGANLRLFLYESEQNRDRYYVTPGAIESLPGSNLVLGAGLAYKLGKAARISLGYAGAIYFDKSFKALTLADALETINGQYKDIVVETYNRTGIVSLGLSVAIPVKKKEKPIL